MSEDTLNLIYQEVEQFQNQLTNQIKGFQENINGINPNLKEEFQKIENSSEEDIKKINKIKQISFLVELLENQENFDLFLSHVNKLSEENKNLQNSISKLEQELNTNKKENENLEKKLQEFNDKLTEFKNIINARKESEIVEVKIKFNKKISILLEAILNITNEIPMMENKNDIAALSELLNKIYFSLSSLNIHKINAKVGDAFNPTQHKALKTEKNEEKKNKVLEIFSDGFIDSEEQQTIIYAKVSVGI